MDFSHPTVWAEALQSTSPSVVLLFLLPVLWVGVNAVSYCGVCVVRTFCTNNALENIPFSCTSTRALPT